MTNRMLAALAALLLAAPLGAAAQGQMEQQQRPAQTQKQAKREQKHKQVKPAQVFNQLHEINQNEIKMAQLAEQKAQSPQVKEAARTVLQDHQQLDRQLTQMAREQNIRLQPGTSFTDEALRDAHRKQMQSLQQLSGAQFDTAFIAAQPFGHRYALAVIEDGRQAIPDQKGKQFLQQAEQKVQNHLRTAERLLESNVRVAQQPGQTGGG